MENKKPTITSDNTIPEMQFDDSIGNMSNLLSFTDIF